MINESVPHLTGGAYRHRHDSLARDAMDAQETQASDFGAYGQAVWYECRRFEVPAVLAESSFRNFKSKAALEDDVWPAPFAFRSSRKVDVAIAANSESGRWHPLDAGVKSRRDDRQGDGG
jgi:hypothetical protein